MSILKKLKCFKNNDTEKSQPKAEGKWDNKVQFILSLIGLSVGLGIILFFS